MTVSALSVFYEHSQSGHNSLKVAASLSRRLASGRLIVFTETSSCTGTSADSIQNERILKDVCAVTGLSRDNISLAPSKSYFDSPGESLLVVDNYQDRFDPGNVVVTFGEMLRFEKSNRTLVLSFGNGESGLYVAANALPYARALGLDIEFYHTTWVRDAIDSESSLLHMCEGAQIVQQELESQAESLGLTYSTTVETADDVAEGLIQFSLRRSAVMIAMAFGTCTGRSGSYVTQALHKSPTPLLLFGRDREVL